PPDAPPAEAEAEEQAEPEPPAPEQAEPEAVAPEVAEEVTAPEVEDEAAEPTEETTSPESTPEVEESGDAATASDEPNGPEVDQTTLDLLAEKEAELERLHMENARLRQSVVGATEVIEELEEPPMPPLVEDNIVIAPYIVSDFVRLGKQLDRDHLVRATMGSLAMIHPEQPNVMISTKHMVTLPRMNERSLCAAPLGSTSPRGAPVDWHVLEVVLASVSVVTGGPAAVIHMHGPHTTAASCEQDLVLLTPVDEIGKQHIGKIIIVDPDPEHPEDYLRQVAEALNQGGMRCVVVRGNGAYAVGADFDQAWANAAMLEHSMEIHLLTRQANLKI
ncbi:MAG: class II aldolase/adducin family protein, partial [Candidatus Thermoplasmatota archaeon]